MKLLKPIGQKRPDMINLLKFGRNPMASNFWGCNLGACRRRVNNPSVSTRLIVPTPEPLVKALPVNGFDCQRCAN
jgi:hypothetical protein